MAHESGTPVLNASYAMSAALLVLLATIPPAAVAQSGPIMFPACEAPAAGVGPLRSGRDDWNGWSRQPTGSLGAQCSNSTPGTRPSWSDILLVDINKDGLDDLCGLWGPVTHTVNGRVNAAFVYGCVTNQGNGRFGGPFQQAHAFNGPRDASIHTTIRGIDFNGDGRLDLCGRAANGLRCQTTTSSGFAASYSLAQPTFSNANGWNQAKYYSTIDFGRQDGLLVVCGRGVAGVYCFPKLGSTFSTSPFLQSSFQDSHGWDQIEHFSTLRYVDVNGDGHTDICGRGDAGIVCSLWRPSPTRSFGPAQVWTTQFRDADGWSVAPYYTSVRFGDINRTANMTDVCGRGYGGLYCGSSNGTAFVWATSSPVLPQMADGTGWDNETRLASMQLVDYDGDSKADVCGLELQPGESQPDFRCARSNSTLASLAFAAPETRTDKVTVSQGRVVSGRLFSTTPGTGFCWAAAQDVNCSNQWQ